MDGGAAVGMDRRAGEGRVAEGDPQAARRAGNGGEVAVGKRRGDIGRAGVRSGAGIEHRGGVTDRPGQEAVDGHARPALARIGTVGQAGAGRLEAEETAVRCGNAHRSAAVRPVREGHDARRDRGTRAAGRPARRAGQVPGVAGGCAVDGSLGRRADAALGGRRAPEGDDTGRADTLEYRAVAVIARVGEQPRSIVAGKVHRLAAEVLEQEGNAPERAVRKARSDAAPGDILLHQDDGVQCGVQGRDAGQRAVEEFDGRDVARRDKCCKAGGIVVVERVGHRQPSGPDANGRAGAPDACLRHGGCRAFTTRRCLLGPVTRGLKRGKPCGVRLP